MSNASRPALDLLDADTPDTVRLDAAEANELGARALRAIGYPDDEAKIIVDQLIDNALCGYPFASLPRILAIATDAKTRKARQPVKVVHETPLAALIDGANNVGYVPAYRRLPIEIHKAKPKR